MPSQYLLTLVLLVLLPSVPAFYMLPHFTCPTIAIVISYSVFYSTLLTSIVLYRISPFHPLAKYPGPFWAKVSKLWGMYAMSTGKYHEILRRLHEEYGVNVRIGEFFDLILFCAQSGTQLLRQGQMKSQPSTSASSPLSSARTECLEVLCGTRE